MRNRPGPETTEEFTRVVAISETRGREAALTAKGGETQTNSSASNEKRQFDNVTLPEADVLVHCGGWAGGHGEDTPSDPIAAAQFDEWLSKQPQHHKLIVRSIHDPHTAEFPLSQAVYVTKPSSVTLGDITFSCLPYTSKPLSGNLPDGNVVVTYQPPEHGKYGSKVGDKRLLSMVQRSTKPEVWLFGHDISQAAGAQRMRFGKRSHEAETMMVNTANADPSLNSQLAAGPMVLDLQ